MAPVTGLTMPLHWLTSNLLSLERQNWTSNVLTLF